jgi:hypothetical protein
MFQHKTCYAKDHEFKRLVLRDEQFRKRIILGNWTQRGGWVLGFGHLHKKELFNADHTMNI